MIYDIEKSFHWTQMLIQKETRHLDMKKKNLNDEPLYPLNFPSCSTDLNTPVELSRKEGQQNYQKTILQIPMSVSIGNLLDFQSQVNSQHPVEYLTEKTNFISKKKEKKKFHMKCCTGHVDFKNYLSRVLETPNRSTA